MTDSDQEEQPPKSKGPDGTDGEDAETQPSAPSSPDSGTASPSRRGFLQASGVAFGVGAISEYGMTDRQQQIMTEQSQETTTTESNKQGNSLRTTRQLTLSAGKQILDAMEQKAEEIQVPSVLTVTDAEGNLIGQRRMDDAWLPSVNISRNKAYTAAGLEMPTHNLADVTVPGESLWGLQVTDEGRLVVFGGGFPLKAENTVVGAVGASGGQVSQDRQVASAGVEKFKELVR